MANDRTRMDDMDAAPPRERDRDMNEEQGRAGAGDDLRGVADEGDDEFEETEDLEDEEDTDDGM